MPYPYIEEKHYKWICPIFLLAVQVALTFVPIIIKSKEIRKLTRTFLIVVFLRYWKSDSEFFSYGYNNGFNIVIPYSYLFFRLICDNFGQSLSGDEKDNNSSKENSIDNNTDQNEANSIFFHPKSFDIFKVIFVITFWINSNTFFPIIHGVSVFSTIGGFFYIILFNAVEYYAFAMFFHEMNYPQWVYFLIMIPKAVIYPILYMISANIIYENLNGLFFILFDYIFMANMLYEVINMILEFRNYYLNEKNEDKKELHKIAIAAAFIWYILIQTVNYYDK